MSCWINPLLVTKFSVLQWEIAPCLMSVHIWVLISRNCDSELVIYRLDTRHTSPFEVDRCTCTAHPTQVCCNTFVLRSWTFSKRSIRPKMERSKVQTLSVRRKSAVEANQKMFPENHNFDYWTSLASCRKRRQCETVHMRCEHREKHVGRELSKQPRMIPWFRSFGCFYQQSDSLELGGAVRVVDRHHRGVTKKHRNYSATYAVMETCFSANMGVLTSSLLM